MRNSRRMIWPLFVMTLVGLPMPVGAQRQREVAPLKYWPAPLYWQPSIEERAMAARPEISSNAADVVPLAQTPTNSLVFVGMTPCRLVDTRSGSGFTGAFGPPSLVAGATRSFPLRASTTCSIPFAQAYSLNITVIPPGFLGYLTIWQFGAPQPLASTLNDSLGTVVANAVIVPAGNDTSGSVDVFVNDPTDLIIDINGYYAPQSGITLAQGTAGAPSLSFSGDAGTGIYSSGTSTVNISATKLELNGNAQVDGGSILGSMGAPVIQFPDNGSDNFSAGLSALPTTTTGTEDTAIGYGALQVNASGYANTALGSLALASNTTGFSNTAIGLDALRSNTTGFNNTASGPDALVYNTTGSGNTASGLGAMYNNTTGVFNTASGLDALFLNTTGRNNIAIGLDAGYNVTTTSNNIHIGNQGTATDSGTIRIGDSNNQTSAFIAGIYTTNISGAAVEVSSSGRLGIVSSSRRYKEDIKDMGSASDRLVQLRPVTFRYKKPFDDGSKPIQFGLIAEEVAEVYPDLVARSADGQVETVKYQLLDSMLLNELKKQNATITAQKTQIESQQQQIRSLEGRLAKIEAALSGASVTAAAR